MAYKPLLVTLVTLWLLTFGGSFLHFRLAEPSGEGFTYGFNRVLIFLG